MKTIRHPHLLVILIAIWSLSCVTLFPKAVKETSATPTSENVTPLTIIPETPIPANSTFTGQIVYNKGDDIYSINADGTNDTRLATGKFPVWSPDGSTIAFVADPNGDFNDEIFLMNSDGTNQRPLLPGQKVYLDPKELAWQPNGNLLVFVALALKDRDNGYDIFTVDINGSSPQKISRHRADVWDTSWSPDGKQIIFVSPDKVNSDGTTTDYIYIINADGTDERKLTSPGDCSVPVSCQFPVFSPDGRLVTFYSGGKIYIMNSDGSDRKPLFDKKAFYATWSPDGQSILFSASNDQKISQLFIMKIDGSDPTYLTDGSGGDWKP